MIRFRTVALLCFMLTGLLCSAQHGYLLANDYTVKISGTSSLHKWDETVGNVSGYGIIIWNNDGSFDIDAVNLVTDVYSIKGEGSTMNNKTYKALKADSNPKITFVLSTPIKAIKAGANGTIVSAKGALTIAGVTKTVDMQVTILSISKSELIVQGSQVIKMKDYGITPPTAIFGTLKTGNEITLDFKTTFRFTS